MAGDAATGHRRRLPKAPTCHPAEAALPSVSHRIINMAGEGVVVERFAPLCCCSSARSPCTDIS